ncbi:hypothetical protein LINPERPRIM_LOCUS31361 [Linum perenne]
MIPPSFSDLKSNSNSTSSSTSTSSEAEIRGRRNKRKRKWKDQFERLLTEVGISRRRCRGSSWKRSRSERRSGSRGMSIGETRRWRRSIEKERSSLRRDLSPLLKTSPSCPSSRSSPISRPRSPPPPPSPPISAAAATGPSSSSHPSHSSSTASTAATSTAFYNISSTSSCSSSSAIHGSNRSEQESRLQIPRERTKGAVMGGDIFEDEEDGL